MSMLVGFDLAQVQAYVFATRRLRDAVAGSLQASEAITPAVLKAGGAAATEILFCAGGNALVELDGGEAGERARELTAAVTAHVLESAPGLSVITHAEILPTGAGPQERLDGLRAVQRGLERRKVAGPSSTPLLQLGIAASCVETRLAASWLITPPGGGERVPVSDAVRVRRGRWRDIRQRDADDHAVALSTAGERLGTGWRPVLPGDELTGIMRRDGEAQGGARLALVHVDGNDVAGLLLDATQRAVGRSQDPLAALAQISTKLSAVFAAAQRAVVEAVAAAVAVSADGGPVLTSSVPGLDLQLHTSEPGVEAVLPIRPLFAGGDDLTFLCDGHLAITLAVVALDTVKQKSKELDLGLGASAGVAIGGPHAPYDRLRRIAGAACQTAKREVRARSRQAGDSGSQLALDWHDGAFPDAEFLSAWRERALTVPDGGAGLAWLTGRPYLLDGERRWSLRTLVDTHLGTDVEGVGSLRSPWWQAHGSRLAEIRDQASRGPATLGDALRKWRWPKGKPPDWIDFNQHPLRSKSTTVIDAIELEGLHMPLP